MPELPEVNTVRKGFHETVLNLKIIDVQVHDEKIFRNCSGNVFESVLEGRSFIDTYRQGKYFFGDLDDGSSVLFHLGMTGDIIYYSDEEDRPKYERFHIALENDLKVGFNDPRKFARILFLPDRSAYIEEIKLGPDALIISRDDFREIFKGRNTSLKAVLLNQKLIAGLGNLYADEICYQAKIHPGSRAGALTTRQSNRLHSKMQSILKFAVDKEAYYKVYPDKWFWKWRDEKVEPPGGKGKILKAKIAGRTTYWVEGVQKMVG